MKTIEVEKLPPCDFCIGSLLGQRNLKNDSPDLVRFDGPTTYGSWGYMCPKHYRSAGMSSTLATKLIPRPKPQKPASGGSVL